MDNDTKMREVPAASGCFRWVKRMLVGILILVLFLLLSGALYQTISMRIDRAGHPPPGELVDVGAYRLHIYCVGEGSPTVILEAGLSDNWLTWSRVQNEIGAFTQVCAYDRAGLGWSESASAPLESEQVAESLHALLTNAEIPGPYVLVGHSSGGMYVRSYAYLYPDEVAGLVFVDSSHENQLVRFPAEIIEAETKQLSGLVNSLTICNWIAPFGMARMLELTSASAEEKPLSSDQHVMLVATLNRTGYCRAVKNELVTVLQVDSRQEQPPNSLGNIPLTVLTSPIDPGAKDPADLPAGVTVELAEQADKIFIALQQELAGLSTQSNHVIAEGSGHYIQLDRPDLVIDAVFHLVDQDRNK